MRTSSYTVVNKGDIEDVLENKTQLKLQDDGRLKGLDPDCHRVAIRGLAGAALESKENKGDLKFNKLSTEEALKRLKGQSKSQQLMTIALWFRKGVI